MLYLAAAAAVEILSCFCGVQPPPGYELASWGVLQASGIFAVSVSGHSSLPAIRNSMAQPQRFGTVLNLSFSAMAVIYGLVASLG